MLPATSATVTVRLLPAGTAPSAVCALLRPDVHICPAGGMLRNRICPDSKYLYTSTYSCVWASARSVHHLHLFLQVCIHQTKNYKEFIKVSWNYLYSMSKCHLSYSKHQSKSSVFQCTVVACMLDANTTPHWKYLAWHSNPRCTSDVLAIKGIHLKFKKSFIPELAWGRWINVTIIALK